jgi:DNA polymerase III alpha subunit
VTDGVDKHNMLVEYANRAKGRPRIGALPVLDKLLPETYGIIVYQEQLQRVFQEVGQTTAIEANNFREHISKKKMAEVIKDKEIFMKGAVSTLGEQQATELWDSLETFGRYGFNRSHAICYVVIGYACAWLKHHYPLEWWTAVLRNADRNEIIEKFWRHCGSMIDMPDIALSGPRFEIKNERIRAPLSLLYGIGPKAQEEINAILPVSTVEEMCQKIYARRVSLAKPAKSKDGTPKLDKQGRPLMKLATSALKKDVISTLIISGAMDGLFPSEASMLDQLKQYRVAKGEVEGKEPDPVDPRYIDLSEVVRFQMKKSILPAYSPPLLPMVVRAGTPKIQQINNIWTYTAGQNNVNKYATIANLKQAEYLLSVDMLEQLEFAIVAYVVQDERRTYQGNKEMAKIVLDVEGTQWELVHWPPYRGKKLPLHMNKPLTGAVVLAVLSKYKADRPFSITHIDVLFPPLGTAESEESPEPQEK